MDRNSISRAAILGAVLALTACAQAPSKSGAAKLAALPIPSEYKDAVDREFALGKLMKTYDDVAWIGTDAVEAAGYTPTGHGGYIVEPTTDDLGGRYQIVFIDDSSGKPQIMAVAQVDHDTGMGHVIGANPVKPPVEPSYQQTVMFKALMAARAAPGLLFCKGATYNTVTIPVTDAGKDEIHVYFLMATTVKGEIPVGGHTLVRVADDGKTILEVRPLAKSCMVSEQGERTDAVMLGFTNLALDYPSAVQVFLMWRYQVPMMMMTKNGIIWEIASSGITVLKDDSKPKP